VSEAEFSNQYELSGGIIIPVPRSEGGAGAAPSRGAASGPLGGGTGVSPDGIEVRVRVMST